MKIRIVLISALLASIFSINAFSCGDSLYRVGKGVSYRVYTAPLPGSVLVYGQSEGAKQLAEALAQSGHGVRLVDNQMDLLSPPDNSLIGESTVIPTPRNPIFSKSIS